MSVDSASGQTHSRVHPQATGTGFGFNTMGLIQHLTQVFGVVGLSNGGFNGTASSRSIDRSKSRAEILQSDEQYTPQSSLDANLDSVQRLAEIIAKDVVLSFDINDSSPAHKKPPNHYCKTMRRAVGELSNRHDLVFKRMVNRLKPDEFNSFTTFAIVADELFGDDGVNWGRIVALYAFAAWIAKYQRGTQFVSSDDQTHQNKIAAFVGKYIASKVGHWILDHGGWEAFVDFFPVQQKLEERIWKGLLVTAIGFGALATTMASR